MTSMNSLPLMSPAQLRASTAQPSLMPPEVLRKFSQVSSLIQGDRTLFSQAPSTPMPAVQFNSGAPHNTAQVSQAHAPILPQLSFDVSNGQYFSIYAPTPTPQVPVPYDPMKAGVSATVGDISMSAPMPDFNTNFTPFPARTGNMEDELYAAILNYPRSKATNAEAKDIAKHLTAAADAMGFSPENTRKMLAVFAHESGGFDPDARSHTGAGGLGQLTGIAIKDMDRLSKSGAPYAEYRSKFVRPGGDRTHIERNVWTSVAYMDHLMKQIGSNDISQAFVAYNTGVGGYRALNSMSRADADAYLARATGVKNKAAEARAYSGHVENAYDTLFA